MKSRWDSTQAARDLGDLGQRIYTSRLLGREPTLVLHGGGNTSVKTTERNVFGIDEPVLYVKGSGVDLATIDATGFAPCRLDYLRQLATLDELTDLQLIRELRRSLVHPDAPSPSVEAILHAILPFKYVDHTHADALLAIMNSPGTAGIREIFGPEVIIVPYVMPGFGLARACSARLPELQQPRVKGIILMHHGVFTFGATARESYERMIELVDTAERHLMGQGALTVVSPTVEPAGGEQRVAIASLRRDVSRAAGRPMIAAVHSDPRSLGFARRGDVAELSQRGAATPDHVIRTKPVPMVGRDVAEFGRSYTAYVNTHARGRKVNLPDPAPRLALDAELGLCAFGATARDAMIAGDLYRQTIETILRAEVLGGWRPLPRQDLFDMEYWEPQQAKLHRGETTPMFAGEVALVTGAASGIGKACAELLLARGAAVVGLDRNPDVAYVGAGPAYRGLVCDLTREPEVASALETAARAFGGIDMLILNAGIFPPGSPIAAMSGDGWRRVMSVNLDANLTLLRECHPLLKLAPAGGRVVIIGSKNVPAPGPGVAAYSVSKAAVNQLARVAALEWGADGIRINSVHPNMVFDTGIWTPEVLESRARHYGLTVQQYRTNNVLRVEVTSRDVAALAVEMCGPIFAKTTAAQVPVDGGNERVI